VGSAEAADPAKLSYLLSLLLSLYDIDGAAIVDDGFFIIGKRGITEDCRRVFFAICSQ
jgi:hypothetical protein